MIKFSQFNSDRKFMWKKIHVIIQMIKFSQFNSDYRDGLLDTD